MIIVLEILVCVLLVGWGLTMLARMLNSGADAINAVTARRYRAGRSTGSGDGFMGLLIVLLTVACVLTWVWGV